MGKLTYEYVKTEIEKENYKLLEDKYEGCNVKMKMLCPENHEIFIRWRSWQQGVRCPHCRGVAKLSIEYVRKAFKERGLTLLAKEYKNNQTKMEYVCDNGHHHEITWNSFQQGCGCPYCSGIKLDKDFVKNELIKIGINLLSDYKNSGEKMKCSCQNGHEFYSTWDNLKQGHGCPECASIKVGEKLRKSFEEVFEIFKKENYELLSTEYINASEKLEYKCPKGHINRMSLDNFLRGKRCPDCHENSKGEIAIKKILEDNNIKYMQQYKIKECCDVRPLPFDFYLNDYSILIEYDGIQHFDIKHSFKEEKFYDTVIHDAIKNQYCEDNKIKLIRIPYWEFKNIEKILKQELNLE